MLKCTVVAVTLLLGILPTVAADAQSSGTTVHFREHGYIVVSDYPLDEATLRSISYKYNQQFGSADPTSASTTTNFAPVGTFARPIVQHGRVSLQMQEYAGKIAPLTFRLTGWIERVTDCNTELIGDISLRNDGDWKIRVAAALVGLKFTADAMRDVRPLPPEARKMHVNMVRLSQEAGLLATSYANGIEHLNNEQIRAAAAHMDRISDLLNAMTVQGNAMLSK